MNHDGKCPHCGRDAPVVYRGIVAYCTACGALRLPLTTPSINLAGQPSKWGGTLASVSGWLVLLCGLSIALGLGLLLGAVATTAVAFAIALPVALITGGVGVALIASGRALRRSGIRAQQALREQALLEALAERQALTAADAARALGIDVGTADALLTALAKRDPERLAIEVDDQGIVWYRAATAAPRARIEDAVSTPADAPAGSIRTESAAGLDERDERNRTEDEQSAAEDGETMHGPGEAGQMKR